MRNICNCCEAWVFVLGMVIPVRSRGQLFGAISFFTAESGRYYKQTDCALAEDIARRAATAIDNARLYQETQRSVNRTLLLQRITAALSGSSNSPTGSRCSGEPRDCRLAS